MKRIFIFLFALLVLLALPSCRATGNGDDAEIDTTPGEEAFPPFSAADLDGNIVSEDIFGNATVTVINIWGTFCSPCIEEMPGLARLADAYADRGVQLIGIPVDVVDKNFAAVPGKLTAARQIIAASGADYRHLIPSRSLDSALLSGVQAVPQTIFFDRDGVQIGPVYMGARSEQEWAAIIEAVLEAVK